MREHFDVMLIDGLRRPSGLGMSKSMESNKYSKAKAAGRLMPEPPILSVNSTLVALISENFVSWFALALLRGRSAEVGNVPESLLW